MSITLPRSDTPSRHSPGLRARLQVLLAALAFAATGALPGPVAAQSTAIAVEFYYAAWNYYFVTSFGDEVELLDGGAFGGVWKRTGQAFPVWAAGAAGALPTCRFFSVGFAPKSSHFYTPFAAECETVKHNPNWQYEAIAFRLRLPDAAGVCQAGTAVLYRLYNDGLGGAPNHRYTRSRAIFDAMIAAGWIFEGHGITGAFACVPVIAAPATPEGLWFGTTAANQALYGAVLADGSYFFLYSLPGNPDAIAGFVQGTGTVSGNAFTSSDARDFVLSAGTVVPATVAGTFDPRVSLNGTIAEAQASLSFAATYSQDFEQPASGAALAGTFGGSLATTAGTAHATIAIAADGTLTGNAAGCLFDGTALPRPGVALFELRVTFRGGPCTLGTAAFVGFVYYDPLDVIAFMGAVDGARSAGLLFIGMKF